MLGAGLLMQSFRRLNAVEPGYYAHKLATVAVFPPSRLRPPQEHSHCSIVCAKRLAGIPGCSTLLGESPAGGGIPTRVEFRVAR